MTVQTIPLAQLAAINIKFIWIKFQENESNNINQIVMVN